MSARPGTLSGQGPLELLRVQPGVQAPLSQEFRMAARLDEAAFVQDENSVGGQDRG